MVASLSGPHSTASVCLAATRGIIPASREDQPGESQSPDSGLLGMDAATPLPCGPASSPTTTSYAHAYNGWCGTHVITPARPRRPCRLRACAMRSPADSCRSVTLTRLSVPSEASSKQREVKRITAILRRLTRDAATTPPTARRELMKRCDVWLEELQRVRQR